MYRTSIPCSGNSAIQLGGGLGCIACGGNCKGLGIFDSGLDVSGWGPVEIGIVLLGGYMVLSTVFTTRRAVGRVTKAVGKRKRRSKKRADLERQLREA